MSVFRIHKTENYTVLSNYHFKEKNMSLKAKGLLSLMLSLPDTWQYSVSGLTKLSKDGKDSVMSALAELEEFGYLKRERVVNDKGQFSGVQYDIYEQPQPKNPISEKSHEENENADNSNAENRPQLNTNIIKYLENKLCNELNTNDDELLELYKDYIQLREHMNAPLTETGLDKLITRAKRYSRDNVRVEKVLLETAIINNWKNIYPPRESELERMNADMRDEMRELFGLEQIR